MNCVVCKNGSTEPGQATVVLERAGATVDFQAVPAQVCGNCGEEYVAGEVAGQLLSQARSLIEAGAHIDVRAYVAA